ncbi:MAG: outer membrane lipoprotein carrier protein LolA [Acidobacteriota bacterium]
MCVPMLCTALLAAPAAASPPPEAAISEARLLEAALEGIRGLVASFTQTVDSPALPAPQVERGTVYMLRPGRMRWEYGEPPGKLAIADGRRTWLYLPEDRQAIVAPLDLEDPGPGMGLLMRPRVDLLREFRVAWGPPESGGSRPLMLTPRSSRAGYQHLLVLTDAEHLIRSLVVVDTLGGRTTYRFSRLRRLPDLDPSLFRFTVPEGIQVQEVAR